MRRMGMLRGVVISLIGWMAGCAAVTPLPPDPSSPFFSAELIPTAGDAYSHTSSIMALPDGALLVAWGSGSRELGSDTRIVMARRGTGAAEWDSPVVVADKAEFADANCVLYQDDLGRLRLLHSEMFGEQFCTSSVVEQTSDDGGVTWTAPRAAISAICTLLRNKPIELRDGRWLLPAYVEATYESQFFVSFNRGDDWLPLSAPQLTLQYGNLQPAVVQRTDGSLFALMRSSGGAGFSWQAMSLAGFQWWFAPLEALPNPGSGLDMIRLSSGHYIVAYNDSASQRSPLSVALSADEGRTWSRGRVIDDAPGQVSYPSLAEGPDGTIHCSYSFQIEAIKHAAFNRAWVEAE